MRFFIAMFSHETNTFSTIPIAHTIIEVDAPGLSSSNLARFAFTRVRRPIFPLDPL